MSRRHRLAARAVHHAWDPSLPPALVVRSGDRVDIVTSAASGRFTSRRRMETLARGRPGNADQQPLCGPIEVRGARAGGVLRVDILAVEVDAWGYTSVAPGEGLLGDEIDEPCWMAWDLRDGSVARLDGHLGPGLQVPMRPFPGILGLAPPGRPRGTRAPGVHGGNLDSRRLVAGSSVWLPIGVDGALLSIADLHAAQGDGEVCGTAIETTGRVSVCLTLEDGMRLAAPLVRTPPGATTREGPLLCATGLGPDLRAASRDALRGLTDRLESVHGLSRSLACGLASVAADLSIDQLVDAPTWTVACCLPLDVLGEEPPRDPV